MNDTQETVQTALIAAGAAIATGLIGFFGGRGNSVAAQQQALNSAFDNYTKRQQEVIDALEDRIRGAEGRMNGLEQHIESLESILRDNGIPVPRRPVVDVVLFVPPTAIKGAK